MMVGGTFRSNGPSDGRPWTFYALATLFAAYLLFLYGPMLVIYVLSFQGPNGGVTFPMVGTSLAWFRDVFKPGQMANIPVSFGRSIELATVVSCLDGGVLRRRRAWVSAAVSGLRRAVLLRGRQPGDAEPAGGLRHRSWLSGAWAGRRACSPPRSARSSPGHCRSACSPCSPWSTGSTAPTRKRRTISAPRLAAAALCHAADPAARHHRRRDGRVHAVL